MKHLIFFIMFFSLTTALSCSGLTIREVKLTLLKHTDHIVIEISGSEICNVENNQPQRRITHKTVTFKEKADIEKIINFITDVEIKNRKCLFDGSITFGHEEHGKLMKRPFSLDCQGIQMDKLVYLTEEGSTYLTELRRELYPDLWRD